MDEVERRRGQAVQQLIYDWLRRVSPEGPQWEDPAFDALAGVPFELRMIHILDVVEGEICNGGWGQLLWNCFPHWRTLADVAEAGYRLIGTAAHEAAIESLRRCCTHCEADCRAAKARDEEEQDWFGEGYPAFSAFLDRAYAYDDREWQKVFYEDAAREARLTWLAQNEGRIRNLLGAAH